MVLSGVKLNYPSARDWMWNYCIYLGSYTGFVNRQKYDLGIYVNQDGSLSHAIVYGNEPGDYLSGDIDSFKVSHVRCENIRRAKELGLC